MPLVRITLAQGVGAETRRAIADGVHEALVRTAHVPAADRFQILEELSAESLIFDPSYLGIRRSEPIVFVQIFLKTGRTIEVKKALYARIADELAARAGVRREDVVVNLVEVPGENWSFGSGRMSFPPTGG